MILWLSKHSPSCCASAMASAGAARPEAVGPRVAVAVRARLLRLDGVHGVGRARNGFAAVPAWVQCSAASPCGQQYRYLWTFGENSFAARW